MNIEKKEQLKAYAEAIAAFADGETIQFFGKFQNCWLDWRHDCVPEFSDGESWRVKLEPISLEYKVGLLYRDGEAWLVLRTNDDEYAKTESSEYFVEWVDAKKVEIAA